MDERKKTIRELETKRLGDLEGQGLLLENLGETLFCRLEGKKAPVKDVPGQDSDGTPAEALAEYRRLLKETADSREMIQTIEDQTIKLKELEENIGAKEEENSSRLKELSGLYEEIGELVMDSADHRGFSGLYRDQLDGLLHKIESHKTRLEEIEDSGSGFFARLGGGAQSLVSKALLAKSQSDLRKFYRLTGEKFASPLSSAAGLGSGGEIASLAEKIEGHRRLSSSLSEEIAVLRSERKKAGEVLGSEGNPVKRIQGLQKHIAYLGDEVRKVCRRFGSYAVEETWRDFYNSILEKEDSPLLNRIEILEESIRGAESRIEKLKAAIAIDEEKEEIEKLEAGIEGQRRRIAAAEEAIKEMKKRVAGAENHIEELTRLLSTAP